MAEVRCKLAKVVMSESHERQIVMLEEEDGHRRFPIIIGFPEVFAIHRFVNDEPPPRPMTHELMGNIMKQLEVTVTKVVINDVRNGTYYARLYLEHNGQTTNVDSRPSDAIALATHVKAPIFVDEHVLNASAGDLT